MTLHNAFDELATETTLAAILAELGQKLEDGGTVALDPASLAALEQVTATVANLPSTFPLPLSQVQVDALTDAQLRASAVGVSDAATQTALDNLLTELAQKLEPGGAVKLQVSGVDVTGLNPLPIAGTFADENGVPFSNANPLPVDVGANLQVTAEFASVLSTVNSTQTPLGANQTFTGQWEEVLNFAAVAVTYFTDQYSAIEGAKIQWSTNGTDVDLEETGTVPPNLGGWSVVAPKARYMRVVFENGPVDQTVLRSEVRLLFNSAQEPVTAIGSPVHDLTYASVNKVVLAAKKASGLYEAVTATDAGALDTSDAAAQALLEVLRNAQAPVTPTAVTVAAVVADQAVVTPAAGMALRLRKFHLHLDPDAAVNNTVTVKVGSTVVFVDEFEPGLPYAETIVVEGAADEALTISTTSTSRLYVNVRTEEFQP